MFRSLEIGGTLYVGAYGQSATLYLGPGYSNKYLTFTKGVLTNWNFA